MQQDSNVCRPTLNTFVCEEKWRHTIWVVGNAAEGSNENHGTLFVKAKVFQDQL